jgi:hypothetical protein
VVHVPRGEIRQGPAAQVVELHQARAAWTGRHGAMVAAEGLQLGLLISADDVLVRAQAPALEGAGVEVQRSAGSRGSGIWAALLQMESLLSPRPDGSARII